MEPEWSLLYLDKPTTSPYAETEQIQYPPKPIS